jgi:hypothetical protein
MSIELEIECDVCKLPTSYSSTPPTVRCIDCEEITGKILELVKSIFHQDEPEVYVDQEGFVKVWGEDWFEMVSHLADLTELEEMKEMGQ